MDGPRSDLERPVAKLGVQLSRGLGPRATGARVLFRKVEMPPLDVCGTEELFDGAVFQAEQLADLFLRIGSVWKCAPDGSDNRCPAPREGG
ncbi:hypothetical protein Phou_014210 [Phytohabitans houttuyneae]|uniref:Uncharacterized protein n=1 Tax=Phytohabitans houttuyneae TaxID=1076126 RepID=A0A6V8K4B9_9ACTN|nr:hypothetical protein Phou_014210 [Phytohabitans houttuyneae]